MKKKLLIAREIGCILASFFTVFIFLVIIFNIHGIALSVSGSKTLMMIDMQSQYIAYLRNYRDILVNHGSLIYTSSKEFGGDYLSIFSYYLASPFNLLIACVNEADIPIFFMWTNVIKMSFAALNFYLLGRYINKKFSYGTLTFAIGYGLMSYCFVYLSNFMWLDGVMILPLVILGLYLLRENRLHFVYPIALAYSLFTSWYIGFMICIFSVIFFIYLIINMDTTITKERVKYFVRFALYSLVGGLAVSAIWFASYLHFAGTKAGAVGLGETKFYSFPMMLSGLMENNYFEGNLIAQNYNYATLFVGIIPLVFYTTFFANNKFKIKERISVGVILLFFVATLLFSPLYILMHGGREPTWFPTRFSFLISFFIAFFAMLSYEKRRDLKAYWYAIPAFLGAIALIIVAFCKHSPNHDKYPISVVSIILFYVIILIATFESLYHQYQWSFIKKLDNPYTKPILPMMVLILQGVSVFRGSSNVLGVNNKERRYQDYSEYLEDDAYTTYVNKIKTYDNSKYFRMELTFNRPGNYNNINNNPFFYSYNGLSSYSSTNIQSVDSYMNKVGYHYNGYFTKFEAGSTYSISSLFGIKYLMEDKSAGYNIHPGYLDYNTFKNIDLGVSEIKYYQNDYAVNLAFMSDKTSTTYVGEGTYITPDHIHWFDHFEYQNNIFKTLVNSINKDIFNPLTLTSIETSLTYEQDIDNQFIFKNVKAGNTATFNYSIDSSKLDFPIYYAVRDYNETADIKVDYSRVEICSYWHKGIYSLAKSNKTNHTFSITFKEDHEEIIYTPEMYYEDLNVAKEYLTALKSREITITEIKNKITSKQYIGTFTSNKENKDILITLPYDNNFDIYIDDKVVEKYKRLNEFTAVDASSLEAGEHKISIVYKDRGLTFCLPISIASGAFLLLMIVFYKKIEIKVFKDKIKEEYISDNH